MVASVTSGVRDRRRRAAARLCVLFRHVIAETVGIMQPALRGSRGSRSRGQSTTQTHRLVWAYV